MLFDLRGRGRRRTVQGVYLGLAILIGGGLILFGVGTGSGGGGLLNGIGNGGGGSSNAAVSQAETAALKAVKASPNSASAWASLVQARYDAAGQGSNFNTATNTVTASGKRKLDQATQAWQRYLQLTKTPDANVATLAARAYGQMANYAGAASAWRIVAAAQPSSPLGFECLAASAFAAGETDVGDLALSKSLTMVPKTQRTTLKTEITAAKTQPSIVQQTC
jgi:hypothetical protein